MWDDGLERPDIERCILKGRIEKMICEFCGGETISKKVRKIHWFQGKLYIVDDVDAEVCQECGERYYHATTLDAIDQWLESGCPVVKEQLQVQVVGMPA